MTNWYADAARFLGGFPDSYVYFDAETQGIDPHSPATRVTQVGYAVVVGRRLARKDAFILDWSRGPAAISPEQYRSELEATAAAMAAKGKPYHTTWDRVRREGQEPVEVLAGFRDILLDALAGGFGLAAHNGFAFDVPLYTQAFRRFVTPLEIDVERLVDTGLMEKCRRMGHSPPLPGECGRADWYRRIAAARSRQRWALAEACAEEYDLFARSGLGADQAHDAGDDSALGHFLLEAMRERAAAAAAA